MSERSISFDALVERYRPDILAYLVRLLGNEADAQDASQDAWLRAYRAFERIEPDSNARAWLYTIASRSAFNALRRRKRKTHLFVAADVDSFPARSAASLEQRDRLRRVTATVNTLPPKQRAALLQRQFQGLSYQEIAACLGCSEAAARANVYQAIKKLRVLLKESGDEE